MRNLYNFDEFSDEVEFFPTDGGVAFRRKKESVWAFVFGVLFIAVIGLALIAYGG